MRGPGARADYATAKVHAWCGGCADDESGMEPHFGDFEVRGVQATGEDFDQDFVLLWGWWGAGRLLELEALFETVCCVGVEPGSHLFGVGWWHCGGVVLTWGVD